MYVSRTRRLDVRGQGAARPFPGEDSSWLAGGRLLPVCTRGVGARDVRALVSVLMGALSHPGVPPSGPHLTLSTLQGPPSKQHHIGLQRFRIGILGTSFQSGAPVSLRYN